jgi:hypothetical protein
VFKPGGAGGLLEAKAGQWGTYKIVSVAVLVAVKMWP